MGKVNIRVLISLVSIIVVIIIAMGTYIVYDKDIISLSVENETSQSNANKNNAESVVEKEIDEVDDTSDKVKELDLSKCLNNSTNKYSNATDVEGNYGLSMKINSDRTSVTLNIDWQTFGPLSNGSLSSQSVNSYQITGFSKEIETVFVGDLGQDSMGITLFYVMNDGTVEYTPLFNRKFDSQNNLYYEINYTNDYSSDGKSIGQHFVTKGAISGVENVIKLYTANVSDGTSGARTTIGATKEGSFYDLGLLL